MVKPSDKSIKKSPHKSTQNTYNIIKNNFTIYQIKKMIGKKLIIPWPGSVITIQEKNLSRNTKNKILDAVGKKNLVITTFCSHGVLYVIRNMDIYLALNLISYKELEGMNNEINVTIIQYPKLSKSEIKSILNH
jgi:hypothetical protein